MPSSTVCLTINPSRRDRKTIADAWKVLPYENGIVTIELTRGDLLALAQELATATGRDARGVMGLPRYWYENRHRV